MTNSNQLCDVLLFVCSEMADETTLALNCLLQIEQERSEEESSVGDALALAFRYARFRSALQILFASYWPTPLLMRPRHFVRSKQTTHIKHIPYNIAYALRENSYQPAPPHSLIRASQDLLCVANDPKRLQAENKVSDQTVQRRRRSISSLGAHAIL